MLYPLDTPLRSWLLVGGVVVGVGRWSVGPLAVTLEWRVGIFFGKMTWLVRSLVGRRVGGQCCRCRASLSFSLTVGRAGVGTFGSLATRGGVRTEVSTRG